MMSQQRGKTQRLPQRVRRINDTSQGKEKEIPLYQA